jgi:hypothetical protein
VSNPTNPFSWQMPTPTDLVTDLPADFEVFGQAVATSLADLLGGTSGQILAKNSNTDMDFVWVTNDVGDITAVNAGTGISGGGTSGAVTITNSMATEITASGDMIIGTGSGTFDNLPIGTTGQVLTADTTVSPYKVKWAAAPASTPTFVGASAKDNADQAIANTTYTKLTFNTEQFDTDAFHSTSTNTSRMTIPAGKAGKYLITGYINWESNSSGQRTFVVYKNNVFFQSFGSEAASGNANAISSFVMDLAVADYVELAAYQSSGGSLNVDDGRYFQVTYLGA